jgi:cytochrome c oxidase cbb3-type subunit III
MVFMSKDKDSEHEHFAHEGDYDGIRELDHPLPTWWLASFLITIIFAYLYWMHYQFGGGQTQWEELASDLARLEQIQKTAAARPSDLGALLATASAEPRTLGVDAYRGKCAACHGPELQGLIGPNLTDDYWLTGNGSPESIATVILKGVPEKGMPAWEGLLSMKEIAALSVYIATARGTEPSNPKPPQGEKVGGG